MNRNTYTEVYRIARTLKNQDARAFRSAVNSYNIPMTMVITIWNSVNSKPYTGTSVAKSTLEYMRYECPTTLKTEEHKISRIRRAYQKVNLPG